VLYACTENAFLLQKFPLLHSSTYCNPDNADETLSRNELERRGEYVKIMEEMIASHQDLIKLVKQCLHNSPDRRPHTDELLEELQRMKLGEYRHPFRLLDLVRERISKEGKVKDRRREELTPQVWAVVFCLQLNFFL
jgi:hypothetical protein